MSAWDYPVVIIVAVAVALIIARWIIRAADPRQAPPTFHCNPCGRKQTVRSAKEWRYCPYCGAPRSAKTLRDMRHAGDVEFDLRDIDVSQIKPS